MVMLPALMAARVVLLASSLVPSALARYGVGETAAHAHAKGDALAGAIFAHPFYAERDIPVLLGDHVSDEDGSVFGLNSASDGYNVIISPRAKGFEKQLRERGYNPITVDLSELLLGGGGIKCCTLELRGKR